MIADHLKTILDTIPADVRLVAVSKFHPTTAIEEAYAAGQRFFGENRVQEMVEKAAQLRETCPDIKWHQIGTLQRNKVKYIAPFVSMIESVDSLSLAKEIEKQAAKSDRKIAILLQTHIAKEDTKSGFSPDEVMQAAKEIQTSGNYPHLVLSGLMGMGTLTEDRELTRREFANLASLYHDVKATLGPDAKSFCELSMGMSDDYPIAIKQGATIVRVGSAIFGTRAYR